MDPQNFLRSFRFFNLLAYKETAEDHRYGRMFSATRYVP
jgi:hypothetical protein